MRVPHSVRSWLAGAAATIAFSPAALADATLTYEADGESMTIESRGDAVRITAPGAEEGYVLSHNGRPYIVTDMGSGPVAIDVLAALDGFGGLSALFGNGQATASEATAPSITRTRRTETVAGLQGEVVIISHEGEDTEIVLTQDADVTAAYKAIVTMASSFGEAARNNPVFTDLYYIDGFEEFADLEGGVLRVDQTFVLQSIDRTSPSADRFVLPERIISDFGELMAIGLGQ